MTKRKSAKLIVKYVVRSAGALALGLLITFSAYRAARAEPIVRF